MRMFKNHMKAFHGSFELPLKDINFVPLIALRLPCFYVSKNANTSFVRPHSSWIEIYNSENQTNEQP
jgi:hypothetical protein